MTKMADQEKSTAERLGYAADARVLILNADDFGMCHDQNEGVIRGLKEGLFTSSTMMVVFSVRARSWRSLKITLPV